MSTVIHAGWPKTGTTTLQREFFPRLPDTATPPSMPASTPLRHQIALLQEADDASFDPAAWAAFLDESRGDASTLLVSWEGICFSSDPVLTAQRLHQVTPDARLFVSVRNQKTLIVSRYNEYIRAGGIRTFPDWLGRTHDHRHAYDAMVECYQRLFGPERVLVLPYEQLVADAPAFLTRLATFIRPGLEREVEAPLLPRENVSAAAPSRAVLRISNRLFRASRANPKPPLRRLRLHGPISRVVQKLDPIVFRGRVRRVPPRHRALIDEWCRRYEASNDRLVELTGLPLRELGYPLPGGT